jgi:phosphoribosylformylglycinamidine (FGAM) synthase PurS component
VRGVERGASGVERPGFDDGEFLIDTSWVIGPAPGDRVEPAVAFDGANFLVVWTDGRCGAGIFGARVSRAGTVLDPAGIVISTAAYRQSSPAIVFDGTNFLVVWERSSSDIFGARVSQAGTVLDPEGIAISIEEGVQDVPAVAFDGTNSLVVWEDNRSDSAWDIYGARVSQAGTVLDPAGRAISTAANDPAVSSDGANFLVVWRDCRGGSRDIYGTRVSHAGTVLDPDGIAISTAAYFQWSAAVSFDGTNFLVVWDDRRNNDTSDIYGARVSQAGTVLDPDGIAISTAASVQCSPAVSFDGTNSLVVWEDLRGSSLDLYGARVNQAGTVLDTEGVAISTAGGWQHFPAVSFDGTDFFVVWYDDRSEDLAYDIYGARVSQAGEVLDPNGIHIPAAANPQSASAASFDGTNFLVVWKDYRSGCDIYGARVSQAGMVLDPGGIAISTAEGVQDVPAVAFDGTNFLVVWQDPRSGVGRDIYGARVSRAGVVLDSDGLAISTAGIGQGYPAVSFDGANFLVVWPDSRSGYPDIYGARVSQAGTVLDPAGIAISTLADEQRYPVVSFDGANSLVVWQDYTNVSGYNIYGARVSQAGEVLDPDGITISTAANRQYSPAVSFDGTNYIVVWYDERSAPYRFDIYGARVSQAGEVLDPDGIAISTAGSDQQYPAVSFDGSNFLVVWTDVRSGTHIFGARVTPAGVVFDSGPVVRQEGFQCYPALARGTGSQMLLVYQGWAGTVGGKTYNTTRIWGKMNPSTGIEETPSFEVRTARVEPTIVRGVLRLPVSPFTIHASLFDMTGRAVMPLRPGANDVSRLSPGVYFVQAPTGNRQSKMRRVILTR